MIRKDMSLYQKTCCYVVMSKNRVFMSIKCVAMSFSSDAGRFSKLIDLFS